MLKHLFNRHSLILKTIKLLGFLGIALFWWQGWRPSAHLTFSVFTFQYVVIEVFSYLPFYARDFRGWGIEEHFIKASVPNAYVYLILAPIYALTQWWGVAVFGVLLLTVILYVHAVLLWHHVHDAETLPPAYFSGNFFQQSSKYFSKL